MIVRHRDGVMSAWRSWDLDTQQGSVKHMENVQKSLRGDSYGKKASPTGCHNAKACTLASYFTGGATLTNNPGTCTHETARSMHGQAPLTRAFRKEGRGTDAVDYAPGPVLTSRSKQLWYNHQFGAIGSPDSARIVAFASSHQ